MNSDADIVELRQLFPVTDHWTYLYNGGIHPCPRPVADAMRTFLAQWESGGRAGCSSAFDAFERLRERFAGLLHAHARNIVVTESTTAAINLAAQVLRPAPGDNIVASDLEFMSDIYPWTVCHSADVRLAQSQRGKTEPRDLAALIDERTVALTVSAVAAGSGFRSNLVDLREIAQRHRIPLIVDAAQALGLVDINVDDVQPAFLACTASKWLMGPAGVGFLYIDDRYLGATPPSVGWFAAANRSDWDLGHCELYDDARRFQGGIPNLIGVVGALAGITLLEQIGRDFIERRVRQLTEHAIEGLERFGVEIWTPRSPDERAGIVFFRTVNNERLFARLRAERIFCGSFLGGTRIDPNFYNTFEEIDQFLRVVQSHVAETASSP